MANYDAATNDFMSSVADPKEETVRVNPRTLGNQIVGLSRDLAKPTKAAVGDAIARRILSVATRTSLTNMEKTSGVPALSLYNTLNDYYSTTWHDWEPETLWQTLKLERAIEPTEQVKNLVQALQVLCKTNFAFEEFSVFENIAHAISMNPVHFDTTQPLEPKEIALAIKVITAIRPKEQFEDDVEGYIAACCLDDGLVVLPTDLFPEQCQEFLNKISANVEPNLIKEVLNPTQQHDSESMIGIQIDRINEVRDYIEDNL